MKNAHYKLSTNSFVAGRYADALKVFLGVVLLFASSQILIPIKPVAITMQTVAISLIGLTYSPRLGFVTVLSFISAGLLGVPVFYGFTSGIKLYTIGYLFGFLLAVPLIAIVKERFSKKFLGIAFTCLIGHIVIYFFGITWLSFVIGWKQALYSGLIIYIPSGLAKIIIFSYCFSFINNKRITRL